MKKLLKLFVLCFFVLAFTAFNKFENAMGIKVILYSGDVKALKGDKKLCVKYDYSNMMVSGKKEDVYLNEIVIARNKKEPGTGDKWKQAWFDDRAKKYQPKFEELFNKYLADKGVMVTEDSMDTKHTIIIRTTYSEPGYFAYFRDAPSYINVDITVTETVDKSKVVAKMAMSNVSGMIMGDAGSKLMEAYALCGRTLSIYLSKNVFN